MSVPLCYYGSPDPLPPRRELRAGSLTAVYEAGDLRYVKVGGVEVCRRWYAAVRDHNWGTVPGVLSDEVIEQTADGFRVTYTCTHRQEDIHFVWQGEIVGEPTWVKFTFDGEAKSTFRRNRIGFCVLHPPATCAGRRVELNGSIKSAFPYLIAPQNPFHELTSLAHELPDGGWTEWAFGGDLFETEDQRNWTDASFKTFCTPLARPFPVEVKAGERVQQIVTLRVSGTTVAAQLHPGSGLTHEVGPDIGRLPAIGLGTASHGEPLSEREAGRLRPLAPAHLRFELDLRTPNSVVDLHRVTQDARAIGTGLELVLLVGDSPGDDLDGLDRILQEIDPPVRRVAVHRADKWADTDPEFVRVAAGRLAQCVPELPVFFGTRANFTELNRGRPANEHTEGVCYSAHPQEHAFDNASLVECCAALADTVRTARSFAGGLPIAVGPITFRKRVNPYATGPAVAVPPDALPPTVDPRQMSLFGAGWTLAAVKYLAEAGADAVTLYETTGWLGVTERDRGCPLPQRFPSTPGMRFPLYHVLADLGVWPRARVLFSVSSDPLTFDGLVVRRGSHVMALLANLTDRPLTVRVTGLTGFASIRTLDETTAAASASNSEAWSRSREHRPTDHGSLTLDMKPYAYVRVDCY